MSSIFLKDQDIMSSPPILGYKVLNWMKNKGYEKISIFDVVDHFHTEKWFSSKNLYFAMLFLFSLGIIDFEESYIIKLSSP